MCRVSLGREDALGFIRINYFRILLVEEIFPSVEMPPPDFSANGQMFPFLPFSPCFSKGLGFHHLPAFVPAAGRRWVVRRAGEIPPSAANGSRCGSAGFE